MSILYKDFNCLLKFLFHFITLSYLRQGQLHSRPFWGIFGPRSSGRVISGAGRCGRKVSKIEFNFKFQKLSPSEAGSTRSWLRHAPRERNGFPAAAERAPERGVSTDTPVARGTRRPGRGGPALGAARRRPRPAPAGSDRFSGTNKPPRHRPQRGWRSPSAVPSPPAPPLGARRRGGGPPCPPARPGCGSGGCSGRDDKNLLCKAHF